jgi:homocitrate synthase NifV
MWQQSGNNGERIPLGTAAIPGSSLPRILPKISDATLRDSAHMPGIEFTPADAAVIAGLLRDVGVDAIEAGISSQTDQSDADLARAVIGEAGAGRAMTLVLARNRQQVRRDLEFAAALGFRAVMLSIPTSDSHVRLKLGTDSRRRVLALASGAIAEAKDRGLHTTFSAEDGARTDPGFLAEYVASGAAAGADRFRLAETVSVLRPADTHRLVTALAGAAGSTEVEMHSHNMLGLAVANALAAAEAGAQWISATVGGLGERGGNTPLGEVLTCMWRFWADRRYDLSLLTRLSREVAARSGVPLGASAGATADLAYSYEIAGQWEHPDMFEAIPAEVVGNSRQVRVRGRLRAALLRACLPPEMIEDLDLDAAVREILREDLPAGKAPMGADDLESAVMTYAATVREGNLH